MPPSISSEYTTSRIKFTRRKSSVVYKQVLILRKRGCSYGEIRKETGLAKSTINNWLTYAGMTLTKEHLEIQAAQRVKAHVIATAASKITRKQRRDEDIQRFIQSVRIYLSDPFFVGGVLLYEAEGSKGTSNGFSNSNFYLIAVYINFLEKYLSLSRYNNLGFRLFIHETRADDLGRIKNFWAKKLSINKKEIRISWKRNVVTNKRYNLDYVGQFQVNVVGFPRFTSKMLAVSDIILKQYSQI